MKSKSKRRLRHSAKQETAGMLTRLRQSLDLNFLAPSRTVLAPFKRERKESPEGPAKDGGTKTSATRAKTENHTAKHLAVGGPTRSSLDGAPQQTAKRKQTWRRKQGSKPKTTGPSGELIRRPERRGRQGVEDGAGKPKARQPGPGHV